MHYTDKGSEIIRRVRKMANDLIGTIQETIDWIQYGMEEDAEEYVLDDCETLYRYIDAYVSEFGPITFIVGPAGPITIAKVGIFYGEYCMMYSNDPDKMPDQSLDLRYVTEVIEI